MLAACLVSGRAYANFQDDVDQAVVIIETFQRIPEQAIPYAVLRNARGLAIMTVTKAGFIVAGRGGKGIVIARTDKGWSGPSAIGTGGAGFGFQAGALVGDQIQARDKREAEQQRQMQATQAEIERQRREIEQLKRQQRER